MKEQRSEKLDDRGIRMLVLTGTGKKLGNDYVRITLNRRNLACSWTGFFRALIVWEMIEGSTRD